MSKLKRVIDFLITESKNVVNDAVNVYKETLDSSKLAQLKSLAAMANTSLYDGDMYAKEQFEDYTNFSDILRKIIDLVDDLDISDFVYDNDAGFIHWEVTEDMEEPYSIKKEDILKVLLGEIANYI